MNKILNRVKNLFLEILPAFIFFLIMFHLLTISKALLLRQYGIPSRWSMIAVISAFIVAKVVLIANRIPTLNMYPKKPLIYNVIVKTIVFSIATLVFITIEELLRLNRKDGSFAAAWHDMMNEFSLSFFMVREAWVFVLILLYCAGSELAKVIGVEKVRDIFFGRSKK